LWLNSSHKWHLWLKINLATNNKLQMTLVTNDEWRIFFVKYKYGNFIHVFKYEFLQLYLQLQCTPISSHVVA
jgi:hypothetical protein